MIDKTPAHFDLSLLPRLIFSILVAFFSYKIAAGIAQENFKLIYFIGIMAVMFFIYKNQKAAILLLLFLNYLIPKSYSFLNITSMTHLRSDILSFLFIIAAFFSYRMSYQSGFPSESNQSLSRGEKWVLGLFLISGLISAFLPFAEIFLAKIGLISSTNTQIGQTESFYGTLQVVGCFMLVPLMTFLLDTEKSINNILNYLVVLALAASFLGWLEHFGNISYWDAYRDDRLELPNVSVEVGTLLILPICWCLSQFVMRNKKIYVLYFSFFALTVLLSLTRSNIAGMILSLFVISALIRKLSAVTKLAFIMFVAITGLTFFLMQYQTTLDYQLPRLLSDSHFIGRQQIQEDAVNEYLSSYTWEEKLYGRGTESYESEALVMDNRLRKKINTTQSVHNEFLKMLMNQGILGLLSLIGIIGMTYYNCFYIRKLESDQEEKVFSDTASVIIAAMTGWIIMLNASISSIIFMFFFYLGLSIALKGLAEKRVQNIVSGMQTS